MVLLKHLADSLMKLSNNEVKMYVLFSKGVGAITEGDVLLAAASQAIISWFPRKTKLLTLGNVLLKLKKLIFRSLQCYLRCNQRG